MSTQEFIDILETVKWPIVVILILILIIIRPQIIRLVFNPLSRRVKEIDFGKRRITFNTNEEISDIKEHSETEEENDPQV